MIKSENFIGIIGGHLHFSAIREVDGLQHLKDGDWVEN